MVFVYSIQNLLLSADFDGEVKMIESVEGVHISSLAQLQDIER